MNERIKVRFVSLFLTLFGLTFVSLTYVAQRSDRELISRARRAVGTVVEIRTFRSRRSGGKTSYTRKARVVFIDSSGQKHSFWSYGHALMPYRVGEKVIVLYDGERKYPPRILDDLESSKYVDFTFYVFGAAFLLTGVAIFVSGQIPFRKK